MTIRLVTVSTLFPSETMPSHGVFVESRLRHLIADQDVRSVVLAPVPWFPSAHPVFGTYARHAATTSRETRFGIDVRHPRYLVIPRAGQALTPYTLFQSLKSALGRLIDEGYRPDAIDAHYLYPDGVAAARLASAFSLPLVLTARGSDVTQWPDLARPRGLIKQAIRRADALITVSDALARGLIGLGADPGKITTLRNGVDVGLFTPTDPETARRRLGRPARYLLSVGHLIPRKGHDRVIDAFAEGAARSFAGWELVIVGEGPEREALRQRAKSAGLAERVHLVGSLPQPELPLYYSGAEALILASSREGWANVLLESMACGTAVVASPAAGNDEVVRSRDAGIVAADFSAQAIGDALRALLADPPSRAATRAYAEAHGWGETSAGQQAIFERVIARRAPSRGPGLVRSG